MAESEQSQVIGVVNVRSPCHVSSEYQNCIITGPTGVGKSYIACALAQKACRDGFRALYFYSPKLFRELSASQIDGSLPSLLKKLAKTTLLVIDDLGLEKAPAGQYRDLLEILDGSPWHGLNTDHQPVPANPMARTGWRCHRGRCHSLMRDVSHLDSYVNDSCVTLTRHIVACARYGMFVTCCRKICCAIVRITHPELARCLLNPEASKN